MEDKLLWGLYSAYGFLGKKALIYQTFPLERSSLNNRNPLLIKDPPYVFLLLCNKPLLFHLFLAASAF